jgi:hypothetical protein
MRILTPLTTVFSKKSTAGNFVPCTGPYNTTQVKDVRFGRWLEAATPQFTCRPAYQMSKDGIAWGASTGVGSFSNTAGWLYEGPTVSVTTDQQLFVRFGVEGANIANALIEQGRCKLDLDVRPVVGRTLSVAESKVFTSGSTLNYLFHPLTEGVPFEDIAELRSTIELQAGTGAIKAIAAWQLSNDGITWYDGTGVVGSFTTFGGEQTNNGTTYGTTFSTATVADLNKKRRARFGLAVKNETATTSNETAVASLRVDYRRT